MQAQELLGNVQMARLLCYRAGNTLKHYEILWCFSMRIASALVVVPNLIVWSLQTCRSWWKHEAYYS